jgi:hypothetical protein
MNYDSCDIIYSKSNLNREFIQILELYNYVAKRKKNKNSRLLELVLNMIIKILF